MDAGLVWTIVGAMAGVIAIPIAVLQLRQARKSSSGIPPPVSDPGLPVTGPSPVPAGDAAELVLAGESTQEPPGWRPAESRNPSAMSRWRHSGRGLRVYISSVPGSLEPYHRAAVEVCYRLHLTPVHLDLGDLTVPDPAQRCLDTVESCDIFVLLASGDPVAQPHGLNMPLVEWEFRCAAGRSRIAMLSFVMHPISSPTPGSTGEAASRSFATAN